MYTIICFYKIYDTEENWENYWFENDSEFTGYGALEDGDKLNIREKLDEHAAKKAKGGKTTTPKKGKTIYPVYFDCRILPIFVVVTGDRNEINSNKYLNFDIPHSSCHTDNVGHDTQEVNTCVGQQTAS